MSKRLYRSSDDQMFAGVCAGIAAYFDIDPTLVRLAFVLTALASGFFSALVVYVILAAIVPEDPSAILLKPLEAQTLETESLEAQAFEKQEATIL